MFEVDLIADDYNRMFFKFDSLEKAQDFAECVLTNVNENRTTGMSVTIRYTKVYSKEEKE